MEELTPELERRIQVEELWGRRIVLEESMNAWRFREYQSRRLLSLLHNDDGERSTILKPLTPSRPKVAQPARNSGVFNLRRAAIIAGLALFTGLIAQQTYGKFFTRDFAPSASKSVPSPDGSKSRTEAQMSEVERKVWKGPSEQHASKLRPLDADLKRIFGSSL
jgi:hypothetical protein